MAWWQKNKKLLIALLVILVASGCGYKYYNAKKIAAAQAGMKTGTVEMGDIRTTVSATGALSAVDNVDINSKITGRIVGVYVKENQHVQKGQLLVKLDDKSLAATQSQKEAKLVNASLTYSRYKELEAAGAISRSQFDAAEADYIVAKADYEQAVSNVNETVITSPIDGYVIGKPTPVGQTVSSGISTPQVIMSIANLDKMQIKLMVDESDIGQIVLDQKVEFTVDAYADKTFTGKVSLISRSATTTNNVNYYTVYVDVDDSEGKLFPTMTARAEVIIKALEKQITVPVNCLKGKGKQKYVQVLNPKTNAKKDVNVTVLLTGSDRAAVKGDLEDGQILVAREAKSNTNNNNQKRGLLGGPPPR